MPIRRNRAYKWKKGEARECRCSMYGGRVHYEQRQSWYKHQRRQAWMDRRNAGSSSSIPPVNLNEAERPEDFQDNGEESEREYSEDRELFDSQELREEEEEAEEAELPENAPELGEDWEEVVLEGGSAMDEAMYEPGDDLQHALLLDVPSSWGNEKPEEYDDDRSVTLDHLPRLEVQQNEDQAPESEQDSQFDPFDELETFQPSSEDEGFSSSESVDMMSEAEYNGIDVDFEDSAKPPGYENFPYSSLPNVEIEPAVLRQVHLLQIRQQGNVSDETHKRYVDAFKELSTLDASAAGTKEYISSERRARKHLSDATRIHHVRYDVCLKNCVCFAAFPTLTQCPVCSSPRLDGKGAPWKTFDYIPLIHRLRLLYSDPDYVRQTMEYKNSSKLKGPWRADREAESSSQSSEADSRSQGGKRRVTDYWDAEMCGVLHSQRQLWRDPRDVGFIFSTDGFSLFKIGVFDIWPLMLINLNLPPNARVLRRHMTLCGIIPGPQNPKDLGSFLTPMIQEFRELQRGVLAWDSLRGEEFTLRAHIALVSGDTMAMAKLMKWTGPNSYNYCRFCAIYGISAGHIYCPLQPPPPEEGEPVASEGAGRRQSKKEMYYPEQEWDPCNLPIYTDRQLRQNQKTVEEDMDFAWGKLVGTNGEPVFSKLTSIVYPWSFTPDVMHLIDENTPRLYLAHWLNTFEQKQNTRLGGMGSQRRPRGASQADAGGAQGYGGEPYVLSSRTWSEIGREISVSRKMVPSQFGKALRDISKYHASYKATELMNFMHIVSPVVLNGRLPEEEYMQWHNLALATEKARQYVLEEEEISEMEADMVHAVLEYERLYYRQDRSRLPSCTTQVHGLLHLATSMRLCGPTVIYHQYPMERTCGFIKAMVHSRSSPNRNISLGILEAERLRFLPYVTKLPAEMRKMHEQVLEPQGALLFELGEKERFLLPEKYPNCLFMRPKRLRKLNQYERGHLRRYYLENLTYADMQHVLTPDVVFCTWGRAVAGVGFNNPHGHEVTGSSLFNMGWDGGASGVSKRDDSVVRYTIKEGEDSDISYFGRVIFYLNHEIPAHNGHQASVQMLAYVHRHVIGRIRGRKLAYKVKDGNKEFIDLTDVQELLGFVESRGTLFYISKTSCFWPKKRFKWDEIIDNIDFC